MKAKSHFSKTIDSTGTIATTGNTDNTITLVVGKVVGKCNLAKRMVEPAVSVSRVSEKNWEPLHKTVAQKLTVPQTIRGNF